MTCCGCLVTKSCPTLCDPMDPSVHGIFQAGILEWVAISFSRRCFQPRDQTHVSCIAGGFFTAEPPGKPAHKIWFNQIKKKKSSLHSGSLSAVPGLAHSRSSTSDCRTESPFKFYPPQPSSLTHPSNPQLSCMGPARTRQRVGSQCERSASLAAFLS